MYKNDIFQFDVNLTLLYFTFVSQLSSSITLLYWQRVHTAQYFIAQKNISFRQGNCFTQKIKLFFLHTTNARKKGAHCKHISVLVFAFVRIALKRETCDFFIWCSILFLDKFCQRSFGVCLSWRPFLIFSKFSKLFSVW